MTKPLCPKCGTPMVERLLEAELTAHAETRKALRELRDCQITQDHPRLQKAYNAACDLLARSAQRREGTAREEEKPYD